MPRIRKKTSKRKLKKKVRDSKKKESKKAKKNPQWKSTPEGPGHPEQLPYKDQILAEVAEQRRLLREAAFDGVKALSISARAPVGSSDEDAAMAAGEVDDEDVDEEEEVPVLINPELPNLKAVLDAADAVVEVLDARDPLAARSAHLEELAREGGKRVLLVLNKVDTCPREAVEAWAAALRTQHPAVLFRAASACLPVSTTDAPAKGKGKGKERERADDAWGLDSATALLGRWAEEHKGDKPFTVAVVGVTNVGKSSFVNSLLRKAALQTYRLTSASTDSPTTTVHPQEVTVDLDGGKQLRVIDTPGLSWHPVEDASPEDVARSRARDILLRSRGRIERLKDPSPVLAELVSRANREDLMLMYNLPIYTDGDANAFLASVARANGFIKRKGEPDLTGAARMILRDWASGKLARYTQPAPSPAPSDSEPESSLAEVYAKDSEVLSKLSTRKELRKAGGLVKLRTVDVDTRKAVLDASYFISSDDEGMEADEEDAATVDDMDEVGMLDEESEGDYVSDEEEGSDDDEDEDEDDEEKMRRMSPRPRLAGSGSAPSPRHPHGPPKGSRETCRQKPAKASAAPKAAPAKKIANAASSKKKAAAPAKDGEDAYDFGQFF
ncbi:P-loop containing nucleoside triphosphate hydrolase protein [Cerioporus squamosus]|nr:P-loop containing nucleoside triphosphate hydrolase protein [Cerioporus squamosus]